MDERLRCVRCKQFVNATQFIRHTEICAARDKKNYEKIMAEAAQVYNEYVHATGFDEPADAEPATRGYKPRLQMVASISDPGKFESVWKMKDLCRALGMSDANLYLVMGRLGKSGYVFAQHEGKRVLTEYDLEAFKYYTSMRKNNEHSVDEAVELTATKYTRKSSQSAAAISTMPKGGTPSTALEIVAQHVEETTERFFDTWEMIKSLKEDQKAWIVNDSYGKTPVIRRKDGIYWETIEKGVIEKPLALGDNILDDKWIIEAVFVDFMKAFTAYEQGKSVRAKGYKEIYKKSDMTIAFNEQQIRGLWEVLD